MSDFKVGDRVRIVRTVNDVFPEMVGKIGAISLMDRTTTPYLVTVDGLPDSRIWCHEVAHLDAPAERPLEVGDYVQYDSPVPTTVPIWARGVVLGPAKTRDHQSWLCVHVTQACDALSGKVGGEHDFGPSALRRIPRPAEAQATVPPDDPDCIHGESAGLCERCHPTPETPPAPVLVDGLTEQECIDRWRVNRELVENGSPPLYVLKPDQIAAAKRIYSSIASLTWSKILQRKVAETSNLRLTVLCDSGEADE